MRRIKEILQTDYIGAIAIGFIVAQSIVAVVGCLIETVASYWQMSRQNGSLLGRPTFSFPWEGLVLGLITSALYLLAAFLLARWLYAAAQSGAGAAPDPRAGVEEQ
jgi:hypothetical protein